MATTPTIPTPAPTPAPAATTKASFWEYLKDNIPNHLKVVAVLVVIAGAIFAVNYIRDLRNELKNQEQITATLSQKYQQAGTSAITGNSQAPQAVVTTDATAAFGSAVITAMAEQNAKINSLTTAVAQTNAQVNDLAHMNTTPFTPAQQKPTGGALTGFPLEETRQGPALASVNLFYDPTQNDPNKAFAGTKWTAYQEQFKASVGEWQQVKTGGFRTTMALQRTISKPDPNDPTKLIAVGTESIPLISGDTIFTPNGLLQGTVPTVPRWELGLGVSNSKQNGYGPYGHLDYRLTNRFGIFAGGVNSSVFGGVSIRLDTKKN